MVAERYEPVLAVLLDLRGEPQAKKAGPNFSFSTNHENNSAASGFFEQGDVTLTGQENSLRCYN